MDHHSRLMSTAAGLLSDGENAGSSDNDSELLPADFNETIRQLERDTRHSDDDDLSLPAFILVRQQHSSSMLDADSIPSSGSTAMNNTSQSTVNNGSNHQSGSIHTNHMSAVLLNHDHQSGTKAHPPMTPSKATVEAIRALQKKVSELSVRNKQLENSQQKYMRDMRTEQQSLREKYTLSQDRLKTLIHLSTKLRDKLVREQARSKETTSKMRGYRGQLLKMQTEDSLKINTLRSQLTQLKSQLSNHDLQTTLNRDISYQRDQALEQVTVLKQELKSEKQIYNSLNKRIEKSDMLIEQLIQENERLQGQLLDLQKNNNDDHRRRRTNSKSTALLNSALTSRNRSNKTTKRKKSKSPPLLSSLTLSKLHKLYSKEKSKNQRLINQSRLDLLSQPKTVKTARSSRSGKSQWKY